LSTESGKELAEENFGVLEQWSVGVVRGARNRFWRMISCDLRAFHRNDQGSAGASPHHSVKKLEDKSGNGSLRKQNSAPLVNSSVTSETPAIPRAETTWRRVSLLIRRIHMFTGLFFAPWMLMYALSTLVMTHREYVASFYPTKNPAMATERELDYSRSFPTNTSREEIGQQILQDLGLDGTHSVSGGRDGKPLLITRQHARALQRIKFDPANGKVVIEREEFRGLNFLERMHRRRGYNQYSLESTWGFAVDAAVVGMVFWSLSGIWLWWEIRATRGYGMLSLLAGIALFAIFLILI